MQPDWPCHVACAISMQAISHAPVAPMPCMPLMVCKRQRGPFKDFLEKSREVKHLAVPSFFSHWSCKLYLSCMSHILSVSCMGYPACVIPVSYITRSGHANRLCMQKSCVLEMGHLSWQASHEDHFHRIVANRPSGGPVMVSCARKRLQCPSDSHWPTLVSVVHLRSRLVQGRWGRCVSAACQSRLSCECHVLCVGCLVHLTVLHFMCRLCRPSCTHPAICVSSVARPRL